LDIPQQVSLFWAIVRLSIFLVGINWSMGRFPTG